MKRRLTKFAVFLLLGAIVNVAVAWGCAVWSEPRGFDAQLTAQIRRQRWEAEERSSRLRDEGVWIARAWRGTGLDLVGILRESGAEGFVLSHRAGWPMRTMEGREQLLAKKPGTQAGDPSYTAALPLPLHLARRFQLISGASVAVSPARVLPLRPMWPGFLVNTALFAAAVALFACTWWGVRRSARRLRGRCLACGYDLRSDFSGGCPECGWRREVGAVA